MPTALWWSWGGGLSCELSEVPVFVNVSLFLSLSLSESVVKGENVCPSEMQCVFFGSKPRGTSLIRNSPPWDPKVGICLGPYGGPAGGVRFFHE
jgi:hypothetical protein